MDQSADNSSYDLAVGQKELPVVISQVQEYTDECCSQESYSSDVEEECSCEEVKKEEESDVAPIPCTLVIVELVGETLRTVRVGLNLGERGIAKVNNVAMGEKDLNVLMASLE